MSNRTPLQPMRAVSRQLRPWTSDIDPSTIPDAVLASERGKRNSARRIKLGLVSGPPPGAPWTPARRAAQRKSTELRNRLKKQLTAQLAQDSSKQKAKVGEKRCL